MSPMDRAALLARVAEAVVARTPEVRHDMKKFAHMDVAHLDAEVICDGWDGDGWDRARAGGAEAQLRITVNDEVLVYVLQESK